MHLCRAEGNYIIILNLGADVTIARYVLPWQADANNKLLQKADIGDDAHGIEESMSAFGVKAEVPCQPSWGRVIARTCHGD